MSTNLPRAYIFGSGSSAKELLSIVQEEYQIIAFLDNNEDRWGKTLEGFIICDPKSIIDTDYDMVIVASFPGLDPITQQLLNMGVKRGSINTDYVSTSVKSRILFLERIGELFADVNIHGCVAEGGVLQGEFAKEINRVFPTSKFYLFDTFSGFDERDVSIEQERQYSEFGAGHLNITSENLVLSKLPNPNMCMFRKGYFPETTLDIAEEFCFVNLDFDLYQPTLAGLKFFFPRMVKGGVILIHDYFSKHYKGIKEAVREFEIMSGELNLFPVGDGLSLGILCR